MTVDQDPCCFFESDKDFKDFNWATAGLVAWNSRCTFDVTVHHVTFFTWKDIKLPPRECREVATNRADRLRE